MTEEPGLAAVRRFIERKQGEFGLLFPVCNDPLLRDRAIASLPRVRRRVHLVVPLSRGCLDPLPEIHSALRKKRSTPAAIHVTGLCDAVPSDGFDPTPVLDALNLRRGQWEKFSCPILIWVPEWLLGLILRHAPDFANWRSGSPFLASTPSSGVGGHATSSVSREGGSSVRTDPLVDRTLRLARSEELQNRLRTSSIPSFSQLAEICRIHARENQPAECDSRLRQAWQLCRDNGDFSRLHNLLMDLADFWGLAGHLSQSKKAAVLLESSAYVRGFLDPKEVEWQHDLSISYERLGDVALAQGFLDEAGLRYGESLAVREKLVASDSNNIEWQRALSIAQNKLGNLALAQGRPDEASRFFASSLAVREKLAAVNPGDTQSQRDLSVSLDRLGDIALAQGRLDDAARQYADSLALAEKLAVADPRNTEWQRDLSVSHEHLGDVARAQGRFDEAARCYASSLALSERLAAADPRNTEWQRDLSISLDRLGDVVLAQGQLGEAAKRFADSLAVREKLAAADSSNTQWHRDLFVSHVKLADLLERQDNLATARTHWQAAYDVLGGIENRGLHFSLQDQEFLKWLKDKLVKGDEQLSRISSVGNTSGSNETSIE